MKSKNTIPAYSRKDFLRTAGSAALFAALGITVTSCGTPTDPNGGNSVPGPNPPTSSTGIQIEGNKITIDLSVNTGLRSSGGWLLITQASTIVVNVDGTLIRAFSSICTHEGCSTNWSFSGGIFECSCHGSRYNTSGQVIRGPAEENLAEYTVTRTDDTVVIQK